MCYLPLEYNIWNISSAFIQRYLWDFKIYKVLIYCIVFKYKLRLVHKSELQKMSNITLVHSILYTSMNLKTKTLKNCYSMTLTILLYLCDDWFGTGVEQLSSVEVVYNTSFHRIWFITGDKSLSVITAMLYLLLRNQRGKRFLFFLFF